MRAAHDICNMTNLAVQQVHRKSSTHRQERVNLLALVNDRAELGDEQAPQLN